MAEDDHSPIVFVLAEQSEDGAAEDLPDPRGARSRSLWVWLLLAATLLAGGALVARARTGAEPSRPAASSGSTSARTPQALPPPPRLGPPSRVPAVPVDVSRAEEPTWCPPAGDGQTVCATVSSVPPQVLAAVREGLAPTGRLSGFEEVLRDVGLGPGGLWYRKVDAHRSGHQCSVEVYRRTASDRTRVAENADAHWSTLVVTRVVGTYVVRVRVSGPAGRATAMLAPSALLAFAADARLRLPG